MLAAARAALAFVPTMTGWGLNVMRFLPARVGWGTWVLAALALVPPLARGVAPAAEALGTALATRTWALVFVALGAAAIVGFLPDRQWYVGDFLLRQGAIEQAILPAAVFPQAQILDRFLHNTLPLWLWAHVGWGANTTGRVLGACSAAGLALVAAGLARVLELRGAAALAAAAIVFWGGYLAMFTGYGKAMVELCVLSAAVAVLALRVVREGRGLLAFGIALAACFTLHRSSLGLVPAMGVTWLWWFADPANRGTLRRPATIAGLALPLVVLALVLPRMIHTFRTVDVAVHLAPAEVRDQGGPFAAAFTPLRALDLANLVMMLAPLGIAIPLLAAAWGRGMPRVREPVLLAMVAIPPCLMIPFIHPAQGIFRDWDNYVTAGVALSLIAAWLAAEALRDSRRRAWIAVAAVLGTAVPAFQWLAFTADTDAGLVRMHAFLDQPPARPAAEHVSVLDYIGIRTLRLQRYGEAATAFHLAADAVPNPRFMIQWGIAADAMGDYSGAREAYQRVIDRTPGDQYGWRGYIAMSARLSDTSGVRRGANALLRIVPGDSTAILLLRELDRGRIPVVE